MRPFPYKNDSEVAVLLPYGTPSGDAINYGDVIYPGDVINIG